MFTIFGFTARLANMSEEEKRKEIEKEKSARQSAQAKEFEKERLASEAAAIAAVSEKRYDLRSNPLHNDISYKFSTLYDSGQSRC